MTTERITASDIIGWDSLGEMTASFEKRGLVPRPELGADNERVLELGNGESIVVIEAGPGESADDYVPESTSRHTHVVASDDFQQFTFMTRLRSWEEQKRGDVKYQRLSFGKEEFRQGLDAEEEILRNINAIQYQQSTPLFETLRDRSRRALSYVRNIV